MLARLADPLSHQRGYAEYQKRRPPNGDQRVLEEMNEQRIVRRDRLEGRNERERDQRHAEPEHPPASRAGPSPGLLGSGIGATVIHMPILAALWQTSYGKAILIKAGLLTAAMLLGAVNLLRTKPRLVAAGSSPELGRGAALLLRRVVSGEVALLLVALFVAAVLSSLAPPPPALAEEGSALAQVGPGKVAATVHQDGYTLQVLVDPNHAAAPNTFAVKITKNGAPLRGANVTLTFAMLDMQMGNQEYQLSETAPGLYAHPAPALVMVGRWGLSFNVTPKAGLPFTALVVDYATG